MQPLRIAIIGTGISGLGAAYLLHPQHSITVYEKNTVAGGHSRTVMVNTAADGAVAVDTGFIVFNNRNYPLLSGLFKHLQVPIANSDMSFGASINNGWLEYGTQRLGAIFAQKRNLVRPEFYRMVADVFRFHREARGWLDKDPDITLGDCLRALKMGDWFTHYFLLAMGGAIWSTPLPQMLEFPARSFVRFFDNHGLLSLNDQPQWMTVVGGSREYVRRLSAGFADRIKLNCGAARVIRHADQIEVQDTRGGSVMFDQVIFACHADQALAMLANPSAAEQQTLGAFRYQKNRAVLHSDTRFMPHHKKAWASWVYLAEGRHDTNPAVSLSYWMNRLQPLPTKQPMIVTLNPARPPEAALQHDATEFEHPVFDAGAIRAQTQLPKIQGSDRIWYCGAYQRYGFHEDGFMSGVSVAQSLGAKIPWS